MSYFWLKYQHLHYKMASFDPREIGRHRSDDVNVIKIPLTRYEPTLRTSLRVVIPLNLERLTKHKTNIERHIEARDWKELNKEQINATRTVQQLKATIRDLEKIKEQIQDSDLKSFEDRVAPVKEQALAAVKEFSTLESRISEKIQSTLATPVNDHGYAVDDSLDAALSVSSSAFNRETLTERLQTQTQLDPVNPEEVAACESWDHLRDGLVELNELVTDFATVVHQQQATIDDIEYNITSAQENVSAGTKALGQASKYRVAFIPVAGAIVGGLIGGPIGLMAGFKLAGVAAAAGGGFVGYQGAKYVKKKHDQKVDMELQQLSKPEDTILPKDKDS